jgi:hypothetical protein
MSQPADRFRAIGSIIGIESLDDVELEMMRLRDKLKGEITSKDSNIETLLNDLSTILDKEIKSVEGVLISLNVILKNANLPLLRSLDNVDQHAEEMLVKVKGVESIDKIKILNEIQEETKSKLIDSKFGLEIKDINKKVNQLIQDHANLELSVLDLLKIGKNVINQGKFDNCPLCEQIIDRDKLISRIDQRMLTVRDLSKGASVVRTMAVPLENKVGDIKDALESMVLQLKSFSELSKDNKEISIQINYLNELVISINSAKNLKTEIPLKDFFNHEREINKIWESLSSRSSNMLDKTGLTDEEKSVLENVRLIEQARTKSKDLSDAHRELKCLMDQFDLANKIYTTFSETKKVKIQEIYNSIQGGIELYFSKLHPNEPHKNIELKVTAGRRASTELKMESFGREGEDPRALTSEGHLDSLGLCIFLAFVKKFNESCPLVVLDDVVSTVDAKHRENICKLFFKEFGEKQLIITTHDELWCEQLRASQRSSGLSGNFINLNIVNWNVDEGPTIKQLKPKWSKIQEKLANGEKASAGNAGRTYLEWIFKRICEITNASVPVINWESGLVSDLFPHARKRLKSLIVDNSYKEYVNQAFSDLERTVIMGNILSHNNPLANKSSIDEVRRFCDSVHALHLLIQCPNCGQSMKYYKELKIFRCGNTKCDTPLELRTK